MADQPKSDMFMQFTKKRGWDGGGTVAAEGVAEKHSKDDFMTEFHPAPYDWFSDYFEVTEFEFNVDVKDDDATEDDSKQKKHSTLGKHTDDKKKKKKTGQFLSWRSASDDDLKLMTYKFQVKNFSFKRIIDAASLVFFNGCCGSVTFPSAIFVRRVSTGGNEPAQAFLRIDFQDVLITKVAWEDGDLLMEDCDFICRGFRMQYKQQEFKGVLGAATGVDWHFKRDALKYKG